MLKLLKKGYPNSEKCRSWRRPVVRRREHSGACEDPQSCLELKEQNGATTSFTCLGWTREETIRGVPGRRARCAHGSTVSKKETPEAT